MSSHELDDEPPSQSGARARRMRVVVVDAVAAKAETLGLLVLAAGHHCMATDDPDAALAAVREQCPDLAVIDLDLPEGRGALLAKDVRALCPTVRMIATAAREDDLDRVLVSGCVFDAFTLKPIRIKELLDEVETARARRVS